MIEKNVEHDTAGFVNVYAGKERTNSTDTDQFLRNATFFRVHFLMDRINDAIDEFARFVGPVNLGDFNSFVNHDLKRGIFKK